MTKYLYILIFLIFTSLTSFAENFIFASDIWKPFFMEHNGEYSGINYDIIHEVTRRTNDTVTVVRVPNKRALAMFRRGEIDLLIDSPLWNSPNEKGYIFSDDIMSVKEYIYFLAENAIEVDEPFDLKGKTVNIIRGYYYPVFENIFDIEVVKRVEVSNEESLVKTLVLKRADAIFMDSISFERTISELGLDPKLFTRSMQLSDTIIGIKLLEKRASLIPKFNKVLAEMKQDGTIDRIIKKHTSGK